MGLFQSRCRGTEPTPVNCMPTLNPYSDSSFKCSVVFVCVELLARIPACTYACFASALVQSAAACAARAAICAGCGGAVKWDCNGNNETLRNDAAANQW